MFIIPVAGLAKAVITVTVSLHRAAHRAQAHQAQAHQAQAHHTVKRGDT